MDDFIIYISLEEEELIVKKVEFEILELELVENEFKLMIF